MVEQLMTLGEVMAQCRLGKSTIYAMMRRGAFPLPRKLSRKCVRWETKAIRNYLEALPLAEGDNPKRAA